MAQEFEVRERLKPYIQEAIDKKKAETGSLIYDRMSPSEKGISIEPYSHKSKAAIRSVVNEAMDLYNKANGMKKYTVSIAVDGRLDVEVYAKDISEIAEKANMEFMFADLSNLEVVGYSPVHAESEDGTVEVDF